jgi:predicted PurR-regulated permease PerM
LLPFVLGIFAAYFLDPAADRMEKAGFSRRLSTLIITVSFFLFLIFLSILIVPVLASQFSGLLAALPKFLSEFDHKYAPEVTRWVGSIPLLDVGSIKSAAANFSGIVVKIAGEFLAGIFQSGVTVVNLVSLILITPVVTYYLLQDWDRLVARLDVLLPRSSADTIRAQLAIIDRTLAGFVRGQLNVCLLLSAYYALLLSLLGLKFSIVIGISTGMLVIFPYVGWLLGTVIGVGVAFFQFSDYANVGAILGVFIAGMIIEGYLLTPKLVGEKVGLHPIWIIFGLLAGGALFGLLGVLLAVPVSAVIGVLLRYATQRYLQSSYYQGDRPSLKK